MPETQSQKAFAFSLSFCVLLTLIFLSPVCRSQERKSLISPGEVPILDVSDDEKGAFYELGTYRYFMLYSGGRVAYKDLDDHKNPEKSNPSGIGPALRHEITISDQDYQEIMDLLESDDFLSADGYPAVWDGVSKMVFLTITYNHPKHPREIHIANYRYDHP